MAPLRGHLIVFEGLDRAGKTTQCLKLVENLRLLGRSVVHLRFPDRTTPIGKMIDAYLKGDSTQEDHVIHLLFSANRWEAAPRIEAAIASGQDIVIDRYIYSGCVYSAAKMNPTLDMRWARLPEQGLPRPDVCFFLDISPEKAAERGGYGAERYEKKEMQDRVRALFNDVIQSRDGHEFRVINGDRSIEEVEDEITKTAQEVFARIEQAARPLARVEP